MLFRIRKTALLLVMFSWMLALYPGCNSSNRSAGDQVVAGVEKFKQERGRLPNSLEELGVKSDESGPVFYEKKSESRYVVWYGTSLGESTTYDSEVRRWDDE
jgi:hypothetical protein